MYIKTHEVLGILQRNVRPVETYVNPLASWVRWINRIARFIYLFMNLFWDLSRLGLIVRVNAATAYREGASLLDS